MESYAHSSFFPFFSLFLCMFLKLCLFLWVLFIPPSHLHTLFLLSLKMGHFINLFVFNFLCPSLEGLNFQLWFSFFGEGTMLLTTRTSLLFSRRVRNLFSFFSYSFFVFQFAKQLFCSLYCSLPSAVSTFTKHSSFLHFFLHTSLTNRRNCGSCLYTNITCLSM